MEGQGEEEILKSQRVYFSIYESKNVKNGKK